MTRKDVATWMEQRYRRLKERMSVTKCDDIQYSSPDPFIIPSASRADLIRLGRVLSLAMMMGVWISVCEKQFSFDGNRVAGRRARDFPALFFVGRLHLSYMWS